MYKTTTYTQGQVQDSKLKEFFSYIYKNVAAGLLLMGTVSFLINSIPMLRGLVFHTPLFFVVLIAPFGFQYYLNSRFATMSPKQAEGIFWMFVATEGVLVSAFIGAYTLRSVISVFAIASGVFFAASAYGRNTDTDLSKMSSILTIGMVGVVIAMLVNAFILRSGMMSTLISMLCVALFTALIAFENQKLENIYYSRQSQDSLQKVAVLGSLHLFLSFINLFVHLLHLLGTRKDN